MDRSSRPSTRQSLLVAPLLMLVAGLASGQEKIRDWEGVQSWLGYDDQFGTVVASAGDVDGDGVTDALITSPYEDPTYNVELGAVYLISGASGTVLQHQLGPSDRVSFGWTLCTPGDMDNDGIVDYLVGCPDFVHGNGIGRAFAYSGATGSLLFKLKGSTRSTEFGEYIGFVGDIDRDGVFDFGVGENANGPGDVYIYSGRTRAILYSFQGGNATSNINAVGCVGDFDGDGYDDFGIGASGDGTSVEGMMTVYSGASGGVLYALQGEQASSRFGYSSNLLGDLDNDGMSDFAVVAPLYDGIAVDEGRVYVYSGATSAIMFEYDGSLYNEKLGRLPTNSTVDFNHDGFADVLIGSIPWNLVHVYSGRTGTLLYDIRGGVENGLPDLVGASMAGLSDVNGDGIDDVLVGAPGNSRNWAASGRAYVFAGNDLFLQANQLSYQPHDYFDLENRGGTPGAATCIVLTAVNGAPTFVPIAFGSLDNNGNFAIAGTVPTGLSGMTLAFMGYAIAASGHGVADSIPETVTFQ